jgi:DNA-directed RNA polymerase sigma subunit (sigma70/sigma32)
MPDRTPNIISYPIVPLEDIAEIETMLEEGSDPDRIPDIFPHTVPLEDATELESLAEDGSSLDPEEMVFSSDHAGLAIALSILSPRERQILTMKAGLYESGTPHKSADIAADFGLSVASVSSTLTRARNRLRAVPNILGVINGEETYSPNGHDDTLQTS